jgi:uncharacterized protein affecting Mg2+/Co2+ transport
MNGGFQLQHDFKYESCTSLNGAARGKMGGWFVMVPGSLQQSTGPPFNAAVADFRLEVPEYIR